MKKLIFTLLALSTTLVAFSQQERQYTQFMYNKLSFNPGYAGSYDAACITGIYRNQWIGLEGAPKSMTLSFDTPLNNQRIGVGLNLHSTKIGITNMVWADGAYSYRVKLGKGTLGIGVQASIRYFSNDYGDKRLLTTTGTVAEDPSIPDGKVNKYIPNFGAGLYFHTKTFYAGLSVPRLLKNNVDFSDLNPAVGKEFEHIYAMTGILLPLGSRAQLQPQILVKYVDNAPLDADVNLNLIYDKRFTIGATYRLGGDTSSFGESIDVIASAYLTDNFMFGLSYDFSLSDIKDYNDGSVEAVARFCFGKSQGEEIINPRFF